MDKEKNGLFCSFCRKKFPYDGDFADDKTLKEAVAHEKECRLSPSPRSNDMNEFEKFWQRIPDDSVDSVRGFALQGFKAGMLAAAEMARVGASKTPEPNSRHSIRTAIAELIKAKAEAL